MAGAQTTFEAILMGIVTGRHRPGDHLVERTLVPELGVSRTPVREAIGKLEALGLVRRAPRRGAVVADFSPNDIEALYFVRLHLERLAARLSFYNLGQEEVEKLKKINRELRLRHKARGGLFELIEGDRQFHKTIYEASKNSFLIELIDELRLKCYTIAYFGWRDSDRVRVSIDEHGQIIDALKRRDRVRFQDLVERQLTSAKSFYVEGVE